MVVLPAPPLPAIATFIGAGETAGGGSREVRPSSVLRRVPAASTGRLVHMPLQVVNIYRWRARRHARCAGYLLSAYSCASVAPQQRGRRRRGGCRRDVVNEGTHVMR